MELEGRLQEGESGRFLSREGFRAPLLVLRSQSLVTEFQAGLWELRVPPADSQQQSWAPTCTPARPAA